MLKMPNPVRLSSIDPASTKRDAHPLARHPLKQEGVCPPLKHLRLQLGFVEIQQPLDHPNRQAAAMALRGQRTGDHAGNGGLPPLFTGKTPRVGGEKYDHAAGPRPGRSRRRHDRKPCHSYA
jgi:hypothetical protein